MMESAQANGPSPCNDLERSAPALPPGKDHARTCAQEPGPREGRFWHRTEVFLLGVGLLATVVAKGFAIVQLQTTGFARAILLVTLPDLAFFAAATLAITLSYLGHPSRGTSRGVMIFAGMVMLWSLANAINLVSAGVQLQPGTLLTVLKHPAVFGRFVWVHLLHHAALATAALLAVVALGAWFFWRLARPDPVATNRSYYIRNTMLAALIATVGLAAATACPRDTSLGAAGELLGFSSHWHALTLRNGEPESRVIARAGERRVGLPKARGAELPNVVLVLLESVSYQATSLHASAPQTTPTLARLASEGAEFAATRVVVSHTTKAFWATLTGSTPDLQADFAEAVPVTRPYESLATLLRRVGYRSAFFEMSTGMFECGPGLFANLGFDWAWFRENLGDPSADVGFFSGDDFRVIEPALEWVEQGSRPFLLTLITTVAHKPSDVPAWFGAAPEGPSEKYQHAVRFTDAFLERLCQQLDERGLRENTILCVLGDHGESFRPECSRGRWVPYEEIIRVPWVIRWPGHIAAGRRIDWPCSQMDVTPTLLTLIGFDLAGAGFEGKDAFTPSDPNRRQRFASWFAGSAMGVIEGNQKWLYWPGSETVYKFDLSKDPYELAPALAGETTRDRIIEELTEWREESEFTIPEKHHRECVLFDHWHTSAAGRSAWAEYQP
ncbi:MAG: LTA synthase family protein [Phycisphaerae bacterium]|nr:LTA synthase family protein [Phycisphaerae bacterium]